MQLYEFIDRGGELDALLLARVQKRLCGSSAIKEHDLILEVNNCAGLKVSTEVVIAHAMLIKVSTMEVCFSEQGEVLRPIEHIESLHVYFDHLIKGLQKITHPRVSQEIQRVQRTYYESIFSLEQANTSPRKESVGYKSTSGKSGGRASYVEKLDAIAHLMLKVRKQGMDMIFPQLAHDKVPAHITTTSIIVLICAIYRFPLQVLGCIFVAYGLFRRPAAHRELIDLVMFVKVRCRVYTTYHVCLFQYRSLCLSLLCIYIYICTSIVYSPQSTVIVYILYSYVMHRTRRSYLTITNT